MSDSAVLCCMLDSAVLCLTVMIIDRNVHTGQMRSTRMLHLVYQTDGQAPDDDASSTSSAADVGGQVRRP